MRGYVSLAQRRGILDVPTERSSHTSAKPRGGGIVFSLALLAWLIFLPDAWLFVSLALGISLLGFLDDLYSLSARLRLVAQLAASVILLSGYGISLVDSPVYYACGVFVLVYSTNTFNFIDGIDGILAGMVLAGFIWLLVLLPESVAPWTRLVLQGMIPALVAFLFYNWSPSRLFMGDVGSAFLGFVAAGVTILESAQSPWLLVVFAVVFAPLLGDCLYTLIVRSLTGQNIFAAHRLHAYQKLSRRWGAHAPVSLIYSLFILLVCGPLAYFSVKHQLPLFVAVLAAYLPVFILGGWTRAGVAAERESQAVPARS